ncbi:hypothetical protein GKZ90_0015495 [Flavobacterium sp. MC2016-06]|uniref:hypothetical protein n=1 Tax=Flavobacterium sp. MC2016-06 TaxID=2676308 RepID=UPI0012BAE3CB|nr:hypothetical protein [Flavobacterium sp. MC2016-06]MBU3860556.1 hypothetical protein [Flavobacterium sp. MC2016-06]
MKIIKTIYVILFLLFAFVYLDYFSSFVMPWQKEDAIKCTLLWGGLREFPKDAAIIKIRKYGSLFTRQFKIEFTSSKPEIEKWILESKRLKKNIPEIKGKTKIYQIHPGEDDSYGGEVKIEGNTVYISMSWS